MSGIHPKNASTNQDGENASGTELASEESTTAPKIVYDLGYLSLPLEVQQEIERGATTE